MADICGVINEGKKDVMIFDKRNFLPGNFEKTLKTIKSSPKERLKRLGVIDKL